MPEQSSKEVIPNTIDDDLSLEHLSKQFKVDMEKLTPDEIREHVGLVAQSRNDLEFVKTPSGIAIVKHYNDADFQSPAEERAHTEVQTLKTLKEKDSEYSLQPLSDEIAYDESRRPVALLRFEFGLFPASALTPTIAEEMSSPNNTDTLDAVFGVLAEYHKAGFIHGDCHLGNFGIKQSNKIEMNATKILDLETAEELDYEPEYTWFARRADVEYLIADVLARTAKLTESGDFPTELSGIKSSLDKMYLSKFDVEVNVDDIFGEAIINAQEILEDGVSI